MIDTDLMQQVSLSLAALRQKMSVTLTSVAVICLQLSVERTLPPSGTLGSYFMENENERRGVSLDFRGKVDRYRGQLLLHLGR